jgi:tetratricopeptide (TPR) repeat protein
MLAAFRRETAATLLAEASAELIDTKAPIDDAGTVELLAQLARAYFLIDRNAEAIPVADRALAAAERLNLVPQVADLMITRGGALTSTGRRYEGEAEMRGGIDLAEAHGLAQIAVRGRLNLGVNMIDTDPAAAREEAAAALVVARRLGRQILVRTLVGNAAAAAQDTGEWDWAMDQLRESLESTTDPIGVNYLRQGAWTIDALRGHASEEVYAEIAQWARSLDDPGIESGLKDLDASRAYGLGRFADAADAWLGMAQGTVLNATASATMAGFSALLARDPKRAAAAAAIIEQAGVRGRLPEATLRFFRAAIDALNGQGDETPRASREALAVFSDLHLPWRQAQAGAIMAMLLGVDQPEARAAADEARAIATRLRVPALLAFLDGLETEPSERTTRRRGAAPPPQQVEVPVSPSA